MEAYITAFKTLLYSWGGDTPAEAIWAANQFLDIYKQLTGNETSGLYFKELDEDLDGTGNPAVLEVISTWTLKH